MSATILEPVDTVVIIGKGVTGTPEFVLVQLSRADVPPARSPGIAINGDVTG
jgi:hypothetical protein